MPKQFLAGCAIVILLCFVAFGALCVAAFQLAPSGGFTARIEIDNRTDFVLRMKLDSTVSVGCDTENWVNANTTFKVEFVSPEMSDSFYCPDAPTSITFIMAFRDLRCGWDDAKRHEPVVVSTFGPECDFVELTPTPDPTVPQSPPQAPF
jgi:hypothetical protein